VSVAEDVSFIKYPEDMLRSCIAMLLQGNAATIKASGHIAARYKQTEDLMLIF
jgi:hypothetical protein